MPLQSIATFWPELRDSIATPMNVVAVGPWLAVHGLTVKSVVERYNACPIVMLLPATRVMTNLSETSGVMPSSGNGLDILVHLIACLAVSGWLC